MHFDYNGRPFVMLTCGGCGVEHAMPEALYNRHREEGPKSDGWACPNQCVRVFQASDSDELRRERDRLKQALAKSQDAERAAREDAAHQSRSAAAYKGAVSRLRTRANAGVCPCCKKTFKNRRRHMASQHQGAQE